MRQDKQRELDSLIRAQDFFTKNGVAIGPVANSAAKKQIDDAVSQIRAHITAQGATTRAIAGQSGRIAGMAQQLVRSHISPITKFARANLKGVSDYETLTKTPNAANDEEARESGVRHRQVGGAVRGRDVGGRIPGRHGRSAPRGDERVERRHREAGADADGPGAVDRVDRQAPRAGA